MNRPRQAHSYSHFQNMGLLKKLKKLTTSNKRAVAVIAVLVAAIAIAVIIVLATSVGKSDPKYGTPWEIPR